MGNIYEFKDKRISESESNTSEELIIPEGFRTCISLSECKKCEKIGQKNIKSCQHCFNLFRKAKAARLI